MAKIYHLNQYRSQRYRKASAPIQPTIRDTIAAHVQRDLDVFPAEFRDDLENSIDFVGLYEPTMERIKFQVKADYVAHQTGKAFIPTDTSSWMLSKAHIVLYFVFATKELLWLDPRAALKCIVKWRSLYAVDAASIPRGCDWTGGVLVPVEELRSIANRIDVVNKESKNADRLNRR